MITRREFTKYSTLALTLGSSVSLTGCNVFTDIENWVPVGKAAFQGIITLLESAGLVSPTISPIVTTILTAFDDLLADVKAYEALNPPPATALAKIQAVFTLIVSNFQSLLSQITNNPIVVTIIGLAQIILSTIAGFVNQLSTGTSVTSLSGTVMISGQRVNYTAKHRTIRQFKKDYNQVASFNGHPEIKLRLSLLENF